MNIGPFASILDLPGALLGQVLRQPWSEPPPLPAPPQLEHWLFERPLTSGGVLLAFAAISFLVFRARGRVREGGIIGGALLALAVGAALAGVLITTDRERIAERTERLIDAIAAGDVASAEGMLSDRLAMNLGRDAGQEAESVASRAGGGERVEAGGAGVSPDKRLALAGVALFGKQIALSDRTTTLRRAAMDGRDSGRTQARITVTEPSMGFAITWWQFAWEREGGVWRVRAIDLLTFNGRPPGGMVDSALRRWTKK